MFGEQQTRTLLGPADPARSVSVAPPRMSAAQLIARAGQQPARHGRPSRRLVLAGTAATVVAGTVAAATYPRWRGNDGGGTYAEVGTVLVPITYQVTENPSPAGDQLRALAGRITGTPYDTGTGRYAYHHFKTWGGGASIAPGGYVMSYVKEIRTWGAPDGSGRIRNTMLAPEFPDEASRRYWQKAIPHWTPDPRKTQALSRPFQDLPPNPALANPPLPGDRAGLAATLKVRFGAGAAAKTVGDIYQTDLIPRQSRAEILEILAGVPGFVWRGEVTDRAGRGGVAITADDQAHQEQSLLVFDPRTGELLAHEMVAVFPGKHRVSSYDLFLEYGRTDQLG
jgi:hypothetical protein